MPPGPVQLLERAKAWSTKYGNGKSHFRSCATDLEVNGWPIDDGMRHAMLEEGHTSKVIRVVEQRLGAMYLTRRKAGDTTVLGWTHYRDHGVGLSQRKSPPKRTEPDDRRQRPDLNEQNPVKGVGT